MNTDHLLTLGMALTTDQRAMERRVRGVFARRKSAKGVWILSLMLACSLGFAAFTTACQPGQATVSNSNAQVASGGDALVSGGDAIAPSGNVAAQDAAGTDDEYTKESAMSRLARILSIARNYSVPRMESISYDERGTWLVETDPDNAARLTAANRFLEIANEIFSKNYTPNDLKTTYYIDQTGYRADVWRFDSTDGVLSGAVEAKTLAFLSADCLNEPSDQVHESIAKENSDGDAYLLWENLDISPAAVRIAGILGGTAENLSERGGSGRDGAIQGWMIQEEMLFSLGEGKYCDINVFGDENLTPTTVCVYPDADCAEEGVFWRADLQRVEGAAKLLHPQDFREGTPGADDMPQTEAINFFRKLVGAAGLIDLANGAIPPEPSTTFYVDYSGARENYWHVEGSSISFDLTSKTGRMLNLTGNAKLGSNLVLMSIPYEKMGGKEYEEATRNLFTALFGKDAVQSVSNNAVYDDHYCTMDPVMADGTEYEIMYQDGLIVEAALFYSTDPSTWTSVPDWLKKWATTDAKTGELSVQGFANGKKRIVPDWLADWVYINNETGEIYAMEW